MPLLWSGADRFNLSSLVGLLTIYFVALFWFPDATGLGDFLLNSVIPGHRDYAAAALRLLPNLGTGLQFAGVGLLLVVIFTVLIQRRRATLPVRLLVTGPCSTVETSTDAESRRVFVAVWMMVSLVPLTDAVPSALRLAVLEALGRNIESPTVSLWFDRVIATLGLFLLVLFAVEEQFNS